MPVRRATTATILVTGLTLPRAVMWIRQDEPSAMVAARDGSSLYVSDGASGRVLRIEPDGTRTIVSSQLNDPTAMASSPSADPQIAVGGAFTKVR